MKTKRMQNVRLAHCLLALVSAAFGVAGTAHAQDAREIRLPASAEPLPPIVEDYPGGIPAFPGAWGGGMITPGGRGGKVIKVTNVNDNGPGSLREAIETPGPRIVVFAVSGIIQLESELTINEPFITIAGQTAPGDGICIAGETTNLSATDIIVRHLRFRRGDHEVANDALSGNPPGRVIVDHCSTSWGLDENVSLYRYMQGEGPNRRKGPTRNITIQWTISSEALNKNDHAFGGTWGGRDSTFHHNLFANNTGRNPSIGMSGAFDYRNNVIYNWRHRTMDGGDWTSRVNAINNYYKPGPVTQDNVRTRIARAEIRNGQVGKFFVEGNIVEGHPEIGADNWNGGMHMDDHEERELPDAKAEGIFPGWPVAQHTAAEAYELVLAHAGATRPKRDPVDTRIVEIVRTGKPTFGDGIIMHPDDVGGYPEYKSLPAPADSDNDGMPDAWEKQHGLDPDVDDSALDADKDGYTNVEEYLNDTDPKVFIDYTDLRNNIDTLSSASDS